MLGDTRGWRARVMSPATEVKVDVEGLISLFLSSFRLPLHSCAAPAYHASFLNSTPAVLFLRFSWTRRPLFPHTSCLGLTCTPFHTHRLHEHPPTTPDSPSFPLPSAVFFPRALTLPASSRRRLTPRRADMTEGMHTKPLTEGTLPASARIPFTSPPPD